MEYTPNHMYVELSIETSQFLYCTIIKFDFIKTISSSIARPSHYMTTYQSSTLPNSQGLTNTAVQVELHAYGRIPVGYGS